MEETQIESISSAENEIRFIGSLFLNNDLFLEYEKAVVSKYYFSDEICRTLYDWIFVLYSNEQKFTEKNIVVYASQDSERLSFYKKMGGWKVIEEFMSLSDETEFKSYFQTIQKFALIRELEKLGVSTEKIRSSKNFNIAKPNDVYNLIKKNIDKVHTRITADADVVDITENVKNMAEDFLERPSLGVLTFLPTYNELFRGFRAGSMLCVGMPGNSGKTRFLTKIIAYNALVKKQKSLLLANEMSESELKLALLTTCVNNEEFQSIHGITVTKNEKEISLGSYIDDDGEYIYRQTDKEGNYTETIKEYKLRLAMSSKQYRDVMLVADWIENEAIDKYLSVINVSRDYSDSALETHVRKNARKGFEFISYDNLKNDRLEIGNWASLIKTTTVLSEVAKSENVFLYGSIQLTDDSQKIDVLELSSMEIAASKGLKTVLDMLVLAKEIEKEKYHKYKYIPTSDGIGESRSTPIALPDKGHHWKLYGHMVDKNRYGSKECILVQTNLNTNEHKELGILVRG